MGILKNFMAGADTKLLQTGILARGLVLSVTPTGGTVQVGGGLVERKCQFRLQVTIDGQPAYEAACNQRIAEIYLPQFQPGATVVAVRVDPTNAANVAVDFSTPAPEVRMAHDPNRKSAAEILASGRPARGVIVQSQPLGMKNPNGVDMYAFTLSVMPDGQPPYQIQVGNPTPPEAIPLLFPGSHVPVRIGDGPNDVVIDWKQALGQPSTT